MQLVSDRSFSFAVDVDELWAALGDVERYPRIWPWLRRFDADALATGDTWRCVVRPPLPYSVRFAIHLDDVEAPHSVTASITGDIKGTARLEVSAHDLGSSIHLTSTLAPSSRTFAVVAAVLRPAITRGHDWVLDTGAAQFAEGLGSGSPDRR